MKVSLLHYRARGDSASRTSMDSDLLHTVQETTSQHLQVTQSGRVTASIRNSVWASINGK